MHGIVAFILTQIGRYEVVTIGRYVTLGGLVLGVIAPIMGVEAIIFIWMIIAIITGILIAIWHKIHGVSAFYHSSRKQNLSLSESIMAGFQGIRYLKNSSLLRMASLSLFFMVIMFYILIYSVNEIYSKTFETEEELSSFFGFLVAVNSLIALFLQFFVANRLLNKYGVKKINLVFPITSVFSYLILMLSFALPSALFSSFNKDVVMTAFRNPVWSLMMNALPGNIQGRARAMTAVMVIPLALLTAGLLLMWVNSKDNHAYLALLGLVCAALYLYFSSNMNRVYIGEIVSHLKQKLSLPLNTNIASFQGKDPQVLDELSHGASHPDDHIFLAYTKLLIKSYPERATEIIFDRIGHAKNKYRDQIVRLLLPLGSKKLVPLMWKLMDDGDDRLRSTCYYGLIELQDKKINDLLPELLVHHQSRFRAVAIHGILSFNQHGLVENAIKTWENFFASNQLLENMFGLELLTQQNNYNKSIDLSVINIKPAIKRLISEGNSTQSLIALKAAHCIGENQQNWFLSILNTLSQHISPSVRLACIPYWKNLDIASARKGILLAINDSHPEIREQAAELLYQISIDDNSKSLFDIQDALSGSPRSLSTLYQTLSRKNLPQHKILVLVNLSIHNAQKFNEAVVFVDGLAVNNSNPALKVLSLALEERSSAYFDLALQALESVEAPHIVEAIRLGMKSKERQLRAAACEALQGLKNHAFGKQLYEMIANEKKHSNQHFTRASQVIDWCASRKDPWLAQCALSSMSPQVGEM